jgi:hypothetical protein
MNTQSAIVLTHKRLVLMAHQEDPKMFGMEQAASICERSR